MNHTSFSLPLELAQEIQKVAEASSRSMAKQIEHSFRVTQAIDSMFPSQDVDALKGDPNRLLEGLFDIVTRAKIIERIKQENPCRTHFEGLDYDVAVRTNKDGTETRGRLLENGDFVPNESSN